MNITTLLLILLSISIFPILLLIGYTLFSFIASIFFTKPIKVSENLKSPVSIIIACYNEEEFIQSRVDYFLSSDEWIEGSELIVVSGGSTDNTNHILSNYKHLEHVTLICASQRMTKIQGVNFAVSLAKNEILVFSDCRQRIQPGSVKKLVANFADPTIGTVTSKLVSIDTKKKHSLRSILNLVSLCESRMGSCLNVFGALYAQRKSVFRTIPFLLGSLFQDLKNFQKLSQHLVNETLEEQACSVIF